MKSKRALCILLVCLLAMSLLAACSKGGNSSSSASDQSESKEKSSGKEDASGEESEESEETEGPSEEELPFSPDNPIELEGVCDQFSTYGEYDDLAIFKEFEAKSGIHITFQEVPDSDLETQKSLILNSGNLPDIFYRMSISNADQVKYAEQGLFVPFSDHPDWMTNLQSWFDKYPSAEKAMTLTDGKIYGAPYILAGDAIRTGTKIWYNSDVLEKLNLEMPKTTQEFYDYLTACKSLDYNENGEADEIPFTSSSVGAIETVLYGGFGLMNRGGSHSSIYVDEDGELQYNFTSDRYQEELRYLAKLYSEGLLDHDIFTTDYVSLLANTANGRVLTYVYVGNVPSANTPYEEYSLGFTEPLEGPQGFKEVATYSLPAYTNGEFMITNTCAEKGEEYVRAAMYWMDHWYSDEGIVEYFLGIKGVTYEEDPSAPGGLAFTDMVTNDPNGLSFEQVLTDYVPWVGGRNPSVATDEFFKGTETWPVCLTAVEGLKNYYPKEVWPPFTSYYTVGETEEMSQISTDMETYRAEWRGYFITGQKDVDADWDEYVSGYEGMRLERYMEIYRKGYEGYLADQ